MERGSDVNAKDKHGLTVLTRAAASGNADMVRLLLDKRADVNAKDSGGGTVLMLAAYKGNADLVKYF